MGFHGLSPGAELHFVSVFAFRQVLAVSPAIITRAIALGRACRLRAADAIIAATAVEQGRILLTQDGHFQRVPGLQLLNPLEAQ